MAEQYQYRRAAAVGGPQVVDLAQAQVLAVESGGAEAAAEQLLATGVVRGHRRPGNQFTGQFDHIVHRRHCLTRCRSAA